MADFGWLVPLFAGAGLTFAFGWLDSTIKYRRDRKFRSLELNLEVKKQQRSEGRDHAVAALELASVIRDRVTPKPRPMDGVPLDLEDISGAPWDEGEIRRLRDVGILIPDVTVREVIAKATNFVTAPSMVADGCKWELSPRDIQVRAMIKLREVLGAWLRIETIDADVVEWFRRLDAGLQSEWAEIRRELEAMEARDKDA